jgi:hypothetical protein
MSIPVAFLTGSRGSQFPVQCCRQCKKWVAAILGQNHLALMSTAIVANGMRAFQNHARISQ